MNNQNQNAVKLVERMFRSIGLPGKNHVEVLRECADYKTPGVGLLRIPKNGKVAVIAKNRKGKALLCTIESDILDTKDLRLFISSKLKADFFPLGKDKRKPRVVRKPKRSFLEEMTTLEKKMRKDKKRFPIPSCVNRLKRVRRLARFVDKALAEGRAFERKAHSYRQSAQKVENRAQKAFDRASKSLARIGSI